MKISTKGRYALRLMIDLAQYPQQLVPLKDISKRQDISVKYLEQIVSVLARANLIRSVRGAQGGYALTRKPVDYTAREILEVMEGPLFCVSCLRQQTNPCERHEYCPTLPFYEGLNAVIIQYLESYSLQDFIDQTNGLPEFII